MKSARKLLAVFVLACIVSACTPSQGTEIILVVDVSGSTEASRPLQQAVLTSILESAPPGSDFAVFRMASDSDELMSGSLDATPIEAIVSRLKEGTRHSDSRRGTNFAKMAEALAEHLKLSRANRVEITIATDGGDDFIQDAAMAERRQHAIGMISGDWRVATVTFVGVTPANKSSVRKAWASAGGRVSLIDPFQVASK